MFHIFDSDLRNFENQEYQISQERLKYLQVQRHLYYFAVRSAIQDRHSDMVIQ